jgi:hypothetical protein
MLSYGDVPLSERVRAVRAKIERARQQARLQLTKLHSVKVQSAKKHCVKLLDVKLEGVKRYCVKP